MSIATKANTDKAFLDKDPKHFIIIKGARVHNLNNIDVAIPRNQLVVVTGVSGSGKSSLTMNTLYAEGQRRYVESLSSYARQFLMRMDKPDVDYIKGICPAIAIEQKVSTRTSRSTVGSLTEIYDYLRLLYARIGKTLSPISGEQVIKHDVQEVVDYFLSLKEGTRVQVLTPLYQRKGIELDELLLILKQNGYARVAQKGVAHKIDIVLEDKELLDGLIKAGDLELLIDRLVVKHDEETSTRIADSVQTAFFEGKGHCIIDVDGKQKTFSNLFEMDEMRFEEPTPHFFNFNSPFGACKTCEGFGSIIGIDEDLVFPDKNLSVFEGAVAPWRGEKMKVWKEAMVKHAMDFDFPIHRSYKHLTDDEKALIWTGNKKFKGLNAFFKKLEQKSYKIQYRVLLSRYRGRTKCTSCHGSRLRADSDYVKINDKAISEVLMLPIDEVKVFFDNLKLNEYEQQVADRILIEIRTRLQLMENVGLKYLSLNRLSSTLSGGETQRINLTRTLGSNLTDSLYILDEPSIGLHPKDTERLLIVLKSLRDLGNTVVVVEHEEEIIKASDYLIDMGPYAGHFGGDVIFQGPLADAYVDEKSLTAKYLRGDLNVETPAKRRKFIHQIEIKGATQHNLKDIDVTIPLNTLTVISGVSGSGKTTLVKKILYPAINRKLENMGDKPGSFDEMDGDIDQITQIELIDQNPIGKSSRSNPVTYIKAYDNIRELFANQQAAKIKGFKPKHFSFNVDGGRCDECKGEGEIVVEMQFLADVHLTCEECGGKRFKDEVLDVKYDDKNIFDVLDMTVDEALSFFKNEPKIAHSLQPLDDVGLGYVRLGQSSSTLSGGEAQRVKLASYLGKGKSHGHVLFIFDEPTTGLHFHDISKLLKSFNALIDKGHSVVVIEHNVEVIKSADWVVDLGPAGGRDGGDLVCQGTPETVAACEKSFTGHYLKEKL